MLHIFDISAYQSTTAPAADAVFVKATEGSTYTSGRFAAQWRSAGSRAKHRGAYHFARPEASSAKSQAARFLDVVNPAVGESVWLDLEASSLSQARTHDWAAAWGDYVREQAPGVTSGIYMGSGYASSNTGRDLSQHFRYWWYPQYPSAYQLTREPDPQILRHHELQRAINRSDATAKRTPIAAMTTAWPPAVSPWLPSGITTGWKAPDIWQFTDNWSGMDASVSGLTLAQLAGGGQPTPTQEDDDMIQRELRPGLDQRTAMLISDKAHTTFEAFADNSFTDGGQVKPFEPVKLRVTVEKSTGGWQTEHLTVGRGAKDTTQPRTKFALADKSSVAVSVTRESGDGTEPIVIAVY